MLTGRERERLTRERDEADEQLQSEALSEAERKAIYGHYRDAVLMLAEDEEERAGEL